MEKIQQYVYDSVTCTTY